VDRDRCPAFRTYAESGKVRVRYLTHTQAEAVLARLPEHQREVVLFALATGLRQRNILDLQWDQVDLDRRIATIGGGDTKNGEALGVPLNDIAVAVIERQQGKHRKNVFSRPARTYCYPCHSAHQVGRTTLRAEDECLSDSTRCRELPARLS
jgi:integrase